MIKYFCDKCGKQADEFSKLVISPPKTLNEPPNPAHHSVDMDLCMSCRSALLIVLNIKIPKL